MRKLFYSVIAMIIMALPALAEEQVVSMNNQAGTGRTEGVAPPVVTYDDVEGTLTVTLEAQALDA